MTFRQNGIFVKQFLGSSAILVILTSIFMLIAREISPVLILCDAAFILAAIFTNRTEPMVSVDADGIRCFTKKEVLWHLRWDEIAELRRTTHMRSAAVLIVPVEEITPNPHQIHSTPVMVFQLSREAKLAMRTFGPERYK